RRGEDDEEVPRVFHPEDRVPTQQHVTDGAAADRRHPRDDEDAEQVQTLAPRGQRAADREDGHAEEAEDVEEHGISISRTACPPASSGIDSVSMALASPTASP